MLVDVDYGGPDPILQVIASVGRKSPETRRISQGVYENGHWSFELQFRGRQDYILDFPEIGEDFNCYGVCDTPEQLMEKLPAAVKSGPTKYVISMVRLKRADQPPDGGWRWHKWGPYIGTQKPKHEYLYDEVDIEEVWTYHIYKVE